MKFFVLLKPKLIHLDNILPLVFELREARILSNPVFIAPDRETFSIIRKNVVLYEGIRLLGGELICINRIKSRLLRVIQNLIILKAYFFGRIISIETAVNYSRLTTLLEKINRFLWGGKKILAIINNQPYEHIKTVEKSLEVVKGRPSIKVPIRGYDGILASHMEQIKDGLNHGNSSIIPCLEVKYTRGLPAWQRFLEARKPMYLLEKQTGKYIFFLAPVLGTLLEGEDCSPTDVIFRESLIVLKEYSRDIQTVFKPHPITDMVKMEAILKEVGFRNHVISHVHPMILMKGAKFVMSIGPSTLLSDAFFLGIPTVEYAEYDSRHLKITGGKSLWDDHVDFFIHRDLDALRKTLDMLVYQDISMERDPKKIGKDFPVVSIEELEGLFHSLSM